MGGKAYKRLQNSSIQVVTRYEKAIIRHILVKTVFFHSEFGISAGFFNFSCRRSQSTNVGPSARLTVSSAIVAGCRILDKTFVNVLLN
jgi:hypothetical protein